MRLWCDRGLTGFDPCKSLEPPAELVFPATIEFVNVMLLQRETPPPCGAVFSVIVLRSTLRLAEFWIPPPKEVARLPLMVLSVTVTVPDTAIPPPRFAVLPLIVL